MNLSRHQPSFRGTVVVVDDDPAVCNSLKFSLEIEGFAVRLYESATELLSERTLPDCNCMVVDENMPGIAGLDLIAKLRDRHIAAPAILITDQPNPALACRSAIVNVPIVEKPLLNDALLDLVRDAVQTASRTEGTHGFTKPSQRR
jgi:two-component system, LuxR family, response regulator FixJ